MTKKDAKEDQTSGPVMGPRGVREWLASDPVQAVLTSAAQAPLLVLHQVGRGAPQHLDHAQLVALAVAAVLPDELDARVEAEAELIHAAQLDAERQIGIVTGYGLAITALRDRADEYRSLRRHGEARALDDMADALCEELNTEQAAAS